MCSRRPGRVRRSPSTPGRAGRPGRGRRSRPGPAPGRPPGARLAPRRPRDGRPRSRMRGRRARRTVFAPRRGWCGGPPHRTRSASGTSRASARSRRSTRPGAVVAVSHRWIVLWSRPTRSPSSSWDRPADRRAARMCSPVARQRACTQLGRGSRGTRPRWNDHGGKSLPAVVNLEILDRLPVCREHPLVGRRAPLLSS